MNPHLLRALVAIALLAGIGGCAGGDTAASDYFEKTTREPLRVRFEAIVAEKIRC